MNSKAEFFRLAGSTVVIEYKDKSIITSIRIIEFGQFNNILSILIETPIPCTDVPKLERKEDSGNKTNLVRMSMFIPEKTNTSAKLDIIKILKKQFNFSLNQTKEYVDSCIGKYSILPSAILQTEVDEVTKKLEPYNVIVSTAVFY